MSLGEKYALAWPAVSLLLCGLYIALRAGIRRDDRRYREQKARTARTRL